MGAPEILYMDTDVSRLQLAESLGVKVEQVKDGYGYRVYNYQSKDRVLFQLYLVNEMGHAWSGGRKGSPATYIDPKGPDASTLMWNFFTTQT